MVTAAKPKKAAPKKPSTSKKTATATPKAPKKSVSKSTGQDILTMGAHELKALIGEKKAEYVALKMKNAMKALKQTHLVRVARKEIARLSTLLAAKMNENGGSRK